MRKKEYMLVRKHLNFSRRWGPSLAVLLLNTGLFTAGITLAQADFWGATVLAIALLAFAMNQAYLVVHECAHNTFLPTTLANTLVGNLYGGLALIPFLARKQEHTKHHLWTGNVEHEPSTKRGMEAFLKQTVWQRLVLQVAWKTGLPIFSGLEVVSLWRLGLRPRADLRLAIPHLGSNAIALAGIVGLLWLLQGQLALFLASALFYLFLVEFFNLPHHLDSEVYDGDQKAPLWEHDRFSQSGQAIPIISQVYLLNFNYHVEHHFYPGLPWHQLPKAHKGLANAAPDQLPDSHSEWRWLIQQRSQSADTVFAKYHEFNRRRA